MFADAVYRFKKHASMLALKECISFRCFTGCGSVPNTMTVRLYGTFSLMGLHKAFSTYAAYQSHMEYVNEKSLVFIRFV